MVDERNANLDHWWKNAYRKIEVPVDKTNNATLISKNPK
jgi:hypothetical protein